MSTPTDPRARVADYLERLRDVLPAKSAASVLAEVSALIEDRVELEGGAEAAGAVDRALAALGPPERLAAALTGETASGDVARRVAFGRLVPLVFAAHLVLAIVLTLVGAGTAFVPGIIGALPKDSPVATGSGVLGIFFIDVGIVAVALALLGRDRVPSLLHRLRLEMPGTRRDAALSLVLLALVALLVNVPSFRDALFALGTGDERTPILSPEVLALVPFLDVALGLFALRNVLLLVSGGERVASLAVDAAASFAAAGVAVLVMTRTELVRIPTGAGLTEAQARTFADLLLRVGFVVCLVGAVLLVARGVRRLLRIRELWSA
ncbi:MAG: hypothetical protein U1E39_14610 [Planctomycetota bacterium]